MAHPAIWRGKVYFYPIGNTSAVSLAQDLCPTEKADMLLLGCGDPRHILYTVYTNSASSQSKKSRKLDFTCCDIESAVIARNVILFTLLADEGAAQKVPQIWNIFFHFYLDKASHDLLISQCRKLVELSNDLDSWNNGPYGYFLRMCTGHTLAELRRLWQLYIQTTTCSPSQAKAFAFAYAADVKACRSKSKFVLTASRAAGPLSMYAIKAAGDHYNIYWETGVCSAVPKRPKEVSHPNPTLAYSMAGNKFAVHYGTDPLSCFHLAEALAPAVGSARHPEQTTLKDLVNVCKIQFSRWCTSVAEVLRSQCSSSPSPLIIRCFVGDALSLCQALGYYHTTKSTSTPFPVAPWKHTCITFDPDTYGTHIQSPAPTTFNVIDTSNLLDHVGVLNVLVVTSPLLQRTPSATLYTEGLSGSSPEDALPQQLCGDIATIGLLLGLIPASFISQFTNRSNMHELLVRTVQGQATQNHERLAWKLIGGAEKLVTDFDHPIDISPEQLAGLLFNVYLDMFFFQNTLRSMTMIKWSSSSSSSLKISGVVHYHRRSYAKILGVVKRRVVTEWAPTMNILLDKILGDRTLLTGMNFYQDLCCQLHLLGVFTVDWMSLQKVQEVYSIERPPVLRDWKMLPQTVCVVLVIPRGRLQPLLPALDESGTPVLQCDIRGVATSNTFSCINTVFGTVNISGKGDGKTVTIKEDATGRDGTSPLVVWLWVPSVVMMNERRLMVALSVLSTPATCMTLPMKLGLGLSLFNADIGDEQLVHILRQRPDAGPESPEEMNTQIGGCRMKTSGARTFVTLDKECKKPLTFTTRADIVEPGMKAALISGATPIVNQVSMHSIAIVLGGNSLRLHFPLPIDAKKADLRIVQKSRYIEVILPLKLALGGTDLMDMFPVIPQGGDLVLWNMHRVNLDQCTPFSIANKKALDWLNPHVSLMMSERERRIPVELTTGSTLLDVRRTLHFIFGHASGIANGKPPLCYALREGQQIFVILYITNLRLDVGSHAMVADVWVMPSSPLPEKVQAFEKVSKHVMSRNMKTVAMGVEERKAWMHLLVAATERCRTWEHKTNCEYRIQGVIPLTLEPNDSPICSCGAGVGTEAFVKQYPMLRPLAPYVTRAAISPLFALSYMEKVGNPEDDVTTTKAPPTPSLGAAVSHVCAACGKEEGASGSLLICSRCKAVRYCSKGCQREDWNRHKTCCVAPPS
ncbi:hypothetical protein DEU56DRAFT_958244 [Suillus clintonianus]|uniref:uncharacterized protein n=1 Tax=Suillus clintonianus TaxID=1904413 RepID=UPI001B86D468|nr:uncharacterized protein DEU56DRAFT_958244 [Suillus clintonianus]KAG2152952.1 hypothetical protein DEU56DRAFT_958244 [Suillus clintonianus]